MSLCTVSPCCRGRGGGRSAGSGGGAAPARSVLPLSPWQQVVREIVALWLGDGIVFSRWLEGLEFNIVHNSFGDIVFAVDKTIDTSCSLFLEN